MTRIACVQMAAPRDPAPDGVAWTVAAISEALDAGAELIVLPELAASGYVFDHREQLQALAQRPSGPLLSAWAKAAARTDAVIVGGFPEAGPDGQLYNSAALVDARGVRAVYRKIHLWDRERLWFTPGDAPAPVVRTRFGRLGVAICYDIEFPELTRGLALQGAELLAIPTSWPAEPVPAGERPTVQRLALATAYFNHVFVAVCDRTGRERGVGFQGASVIACPDGLPVALCKPTGCRQTLLADCDLARARNKRLSERNDAFADRRPELYCTLLTQRG